MVRLPRNEKQTYRMNSRAQMWPSGLTLAMTLTLNFQGQIWNLLYLRQKWSDCHKTKYKHIYWTPQWPQMWPMGLTLNITLTFEFCRSNMTLTFDQSHDLDHGSWPMGLTLTITLTFEFCRSNMTLTFDHTHDLDHGSSWSNFEIALSQNGRADWHFTKGMAVGHSWPWPFGDQGQVYGSTK